MPTEPIAQVPQADSWLWEILDPKVDVPVAWLRERFAFIARALREGNFSREAALVPKLGAASQLASVEVSGGRDAKFVVVYARKRPATWQPGFQETLTYGPFVAGTDLIYDLTGEFLQGKARPFVADFRELPLRVYAVLPFQMERMDLAAQQRVKIPTVPSSCGGFELAARLRFLDAAGEPILGELPYYVAMRHSESGVAGGMYLATRPAEGFPKGFCIPVKNRDGRWTLTVRSLLTGDEATLPFEVKHVAGRLRKQDLALASAGLQFRRAPEPVKLSL